MATGNIPIQQQVKVWQEQSNTRHLVADIGWFGLAIPAIGSFLSIYAIKLGADAFQLGLLSSLPAIVMLIAAIPAQWWSSRFPNAIRAIMIPTFLSRVRLLLMGAVPFLPEAWRVPALLIVVSTFAATVSVSNVVFLVMLRETVSDARLTGLVSRRQMTMNLCVAGSTLALGFWLEHAPYPLNYQVMYVAAFLATLVSMWHLTRIKVLYPENTADSTPPSRQALLTPWQDRSFRLLAPVIAMLFIGYFSIIPVIPLRLVNDLGASEGFISIYSFLELIGAATMAYFSGRVVNRFGERPVVLVAMSLTALSALVLAGAPSLLWTLPAALINGGAWVTTDITQFSFFSHHIKNAGRPSYTTAYFQAVSLAIFIGPMIGSTLADSGVDLRAVLLVGAGLRVLAGVLMRLYRADRVPQPVPARTGGETA